MILETAPLPYFSHLTHSFPSEATVLDTAHLREKCFPVKKKGATEQQEHVGNRNGLKKDNLITLEAIMTNYDYDLGGDYDQL